MSRDQIQLSDWPMQQSTIQSNEWFGLTKWLGCLNQMTNQWNICWLEQSTDRWNRMNLTKNVGTVDTS